jgi:hypothetical protein
MKKTIVTTLLAIVAAVSVQAQGTVLFNNLSGTAVNAIIRDVDGTALLGTAFLAQLYYGTPGTSPDAMKAVGAIVNFRTGGFAGYVNVGSLGSRTLSDPLIQPGSQATLQIRAWRAADGATYEIASRANGAHYGASSPITIATGNVPDPATGIPSPPPPMLGLQGFSLHIVPEPSTIALGVLGLSSLLLFRRKKA